jgi:hypothetical protein
VLPTTGRVGLDDQHFRLLRNELRQASDLRENGFGAHLALGPHRRGANFLQHALSDEIIEPMSFGQ